MNINIQLLNTAEQEIIVQQATIDFNMFEIRSSALMLASDTVCYALKKFGENCQDKDETELTNVIIDWLNDDVNEVYSYVVKLYRDTDVTKNRQSLINAMAAIDLFKDINRQDY